MPLSTAGLHGEPIASTTARQRKDAATVSEFSLSLDQGAVMLAFQPVVVVGEADGASVRHPLYSEVLTRLGRIGGGASCGKIIEALERLDHIAWYDMLVLATVLDLLDAHPHVSLGCNISALTLRMTNAWDAAFTLLRQNPAVARRLTLEITETAVLPDTDQALRITGMLQMLGCKVAIDDLGSGRTALAFVDDCRPDIIKIDRSVLQAGAGSPLSRRKADGLLTAMVRLSAHLSPCVVVEGIDSEEQLARAIDAGANAVQGHFIEAPRLQPGWLAAPVPLDVRLGGFGVPRRPEPAQ